MVGVSTPGNRSDTMPLNSGVSREVSLATFISFMDSSRICTGTRLVTQNAGVSAGGGGGGEGGKGGKGGRGDGTG